MVMRRPPAFDGKGRARDRGAAARAQEYRQRADLLRRHELARRLGLEERVADDLLLGETTRFRGLRYLFFHERRQPVARADGVHRDAVLRRFQGDRLGGAQYAMLGSHIGRLVGRGDEGVRGGHVNDAAQLRAFISGTTARMAWKAAERLMACERVIASIASSVAAK
jgi:hypothetical protein